MKKRLIMLLIGKDIDYITSRINKYIDLCEENRDKKEGVTYWVVWLQMARRELIKLIK